MRNRTLIVSSILLVFYLLPGLEAAEQKVLLESKVATDGDFLTLPVEIDGKQYSFAVDTGAVATVLDKSFQKELVVFDESMKEAEILNGAWSKLYRSPLMTIKGTESGTLSFVRNSPVWCVDLSDLREASDQLIAGVLGMDFLEQYALELDLAAGELRLLDSESLTITQHDGLLNMDMVDRKLPNSDVVGHSACVQIRSEKVKYWALIDTGAMFASLYIDREARVILTEREQLWPWPLMHEVDGEIKIGASDPATLRELKVGPFTHYLLDVKGTDLGCKLGLHYWRRYRATFDFPRKLVYLDKSPLFDMLDESGHSGIFVESVPGNKKIKVVMCIMHGCFAEKHGVQVGDRLLSINGQGVEDASLQNVLRRLSARRERECELRLERDGKKFTVTLPKVGKMPKLDDTKPDKVNEDL